MSEVQEDSVTNTNTAESEQKEAEEKFYPEGESGEKEAKEEETTNESNEPESDSSESSGEESQEQEQKETKEEDGEKLQESLDYELAVKDGSLVSKERVDKIAEYAKKRKLSKDDAEGLLSQFEETLTEHQDALAKQAEESRKETQQAWIKELKDDPDFGGANFEKNVALAQKGMKEVFSEAFMTMADQSGLGNEPEFVKGLKQIGEMISEDSFIMGKQPRQEVKKSAEEIFFGENN